MKCKDLIRKGMVWSLGNDNDIYFWYDNWIENRSLIELLNMEDDIQPNIQTKVSEFIQDKKWNVQKLHQYVNDHLVVQKIIGIPIPITKISDSYYWGLTSSGLFTTKSTTWHVQGCHTPERQSW